MELHILVSKKGTQVVRTTNLHEVLALPTHYYNKNVRKWIRDYYAFSDDIRLPVAMKDYAVKKMKHSELEDYYISLEMARLIALRSDSKVKESVARWILKQEKTTNKTTSKENLTEAQVLRVMELFAKFRSSNHQTELPSITSLGLGNNLGGGMREAC